QPKVRASSSRLRPTPAKAARFDNITYGDATKVCTSNIPPSRSTVGTSSCPSRGANHRSLHGRELNSRAAAASRMCRALSHETVSAYLKLEFVLASQSPRGTPNTADKRVAALAAKRVTPSDGSAPSPKYAVESAIGTAPNKAKSGPIRYPTISTASKSSGHGR